MINLIIDNFVIEEFYEITFRLISNIVILLAIIFGYSFINYELKEHKRSNRLILGVVTGIASILIMLNPWTPTVGLFFDTRTILFAIVGLHFGLTPSSIGGIIAILYRVFIGGSGAFVGVLSIVLSITYGLIWRYFLYYNFKKLRVVGTIIFAFTSQLLIFILFVFGLDGITELIYLSIVYTILFPLITFVISLTLEKQGRGFALSIDIKKQLALLTSSYDSIENMEMYALDKSFNYIMFNKFHRDKMFEYYGVEIEVGMNFTSLIENKEMKLRITTNLTRVLDGEFVFNTQQVETNQDKFIEERYNPIYMDNQITGITIFSYDITERVNYEKSILYLSYHDSLTGLFNRRHFSAIIDGLNTTSNYPLSIIQSDINGLKIINDAFGHDLGDKLLSTVADSFKQTFKEPDLTFRVGGDEFLVLLPNTSYDEAVSKIEDLKKRLFEIKIKGINLSLSYGVSTITNSDENLERILKEAEDKMYQSKLFNIKNNRYDLIRTIMNALNEKDPVAEKHITRVTKVAALLGNYLGLGKTELKQLEQISKLHDIGKIVIPSEILNKVDPLTDDEWAEIKRHPEIGYRIISTASEHLNIAYDILSHHENYDGSGYPQGLKGDEIPFKARIISVADAFDAMMSNRPYRKAKTFDEAITELNRCANTQFDPSVIKVINDNIESFRKIFK